MCVEGGNKSKGRWNSLKELMELMIYPAMKLCHSYDKQKRKVVDMITYEAFIWVLKFEVG